MCKSEVKNQAYVSLNILALKKIWKIIFVNSWVEFDSFVTFSMKSQLSIQ